MKTKGEMKSFTCPACGWTVKSPWGDDDVLEYAQMHGKKRHADMPMTKEQINMAIK
jgi:predicted small metal-binding protein